MLLLLSSNATAYRNLVLKTDEVGFLLTTKTGIREKELQRGFQFAVDNRCFTEAFNEAAYMELLTKLQPYQSQCLFVAVPDVVGDATETHRLWLRYAPKLRRAGWPLAYVWQDGLTQLPRIQCAAWFVGGTDDYKKGQDVARLINCINPERHWLHIGRVNSYERIDHFVKLVKGKPCSIDGTTTAIEPSKARKLVIHIRSRKDQRPLDLAA